MGDSGRLVSLRVQTLTTLKHGTVTGYATCGCRCSECRAANTRYRAKRRAGMPAKLDGRPPSLPRPTVDGQRWKQDARCKGMDPEVWFPDVGSKIESANLKAICNDCPVTAECLDYAMRAGEREGIWGGLSPRQRRTYRKVWLREQRESA